MIGIEEVTQYAARFGAPQSQIIRDHLISHVLLAIGTDPQTSRYVTFFGGTGLCRTWLPELRLSEDIDLLVDSKEAGAEITKQVSRHLRRQFPNHQWAQLGSAHDVDTWSLSSGDSAVKIQFVSWRREWKLIPTTIFGVQLRYSDLPDTVELIVPTASGFATMKLLAWFDRAAPRDLFDLAAQAQAGHIDVPAIQLVQKIAGHRPTSTSLGRRVPKSVEEAWQRELGHQLTTTRTAAECFGIVRDVLGELDAE